MPRSSTAALRKARGSVHGDFNVGAAIAQGTTDLWRGSPNWGKLNATQRESLQMIAHKVQRILTGDQNYSDHWDDIAGYAHLAVVSPSSAGRVLSSARRKKRKTKPKKSSTKKVKQVAIRSKASGRVVQRKTPKKKAISQQSVAEAA